MFDLAIAIEFVSIIHLFLWEENSYLLREYLDDNQHRNGIHAQTIQKEYERYTCRWHPIECMIIGQITKIGGKHHESNGSGQR